MDLRTTSPAQALGSAASSPTGTATSSLPAGRAPGAGGGEGQAWGGNRRGTRGPVRPDGDGRAGHAGEAGHPDGDRPPDADRSRAIPGGGGRIAGGRRPAPQRPESGRGGWVMG